MDLGSVAYRHAKEMQTQLAAAVCDGRQPNTLLLLEHPHVYTRGRLAKPDHIRLTPNQLSAQRIEVVDTDRGGQVTYHGPGQLVAYPIISLRNWGGPLQYVRTLEQVIINALADFDIVAGVERGLTGVWVGPAKIAAIGVKISRGVARHGFAININPDLARFNSIIPCGVSDRPVTSMAQVLAQQGQMKKPEPEAVRERVAYRFGEGMGFRMEKAHFGISPPGSSTLTKTGYTT